MIDTCPGIIPGFYPDKNGSSQGIFGSFHGGTGSVQARDERLDSFESPALFPAYYKAYIIRRITSGETSGPAGTFQKMCRSMNRKTMEVLPLSGTIHSRLILQARLKD
jgi:hypothetical protein